MASRGSQDHLCGDGFAAAPKHTPGPWSHEDSEIYAGDVLIAETVPTAGDPVAKPGFGKAELANARLIAAAPALLEAAENVMAVVPIETFEGRCGDEAVSLKFMLSDLRNLAQAIHLATGGGDA